MNCYRCGAELPEGAKVCAVCGTPIDEEKAVEGAAGARLSVKGVIIGAAAAVVVVLAVVIAVGKSGDVRRMMPPEPSEPESERRAPRGDNFIRLPASMEETEPERGAEAERETEAETQEAAQEGWISIVDRYKRIECVAPRSFERVHDDWGVTVLASHEGEASIRIAVIDVVQFESAAEALDLLRTEMVGSVEVYAEVGDGWYEAEFINGRDTVHRRCFVEENAIRYFEFRYPTEKVEYREDIEYMMENFKVTEAEEEEAVSE